MVAKAQREMLDDIKVTNGCDVCGENDPIVLDFDHIAPELKAHNVSRMVGRYATASILFEVAKCRVLCANDHRRHTHNQRNT